MLEEITVKIDGKTYFDLLRKAQLYDELGSPTTIESLIDRIQDLEDRISGYTATYERTEPYIASWVANSTSPVVLPNGENADSFDIIINGKAR